MTAEEDPAERPRAGRRRPHLPFWLEAPLLIVVAVVLAMLVKTFLIQVFWIPSESMQQTLLYGDRVLVNKVVYEFRVPRRGEVVVFTGVDWGPDRDYIKRVIGLPGDTVACCDDAGNVMVNGGSLEEPYIYENSTQPTRTFGPVTVPAGRLWVMGDHRGKSGDSRAHIADKWKGTVPIDGVVGRAFAITWPIGRIGRLQAPP